MANALFDKFRENCLLAGTTHVSWSTGSIRVLLMSTKYTFAAGDQFVSSVIGGASTKLVKRSTKTTRPDEELIVQTPVVKLE